MQKKMMAAAVAGALAAPAMAFAQASTVQIYGTVIVNYNYLDRGSGAIKIDMLNSHDANIGFRGEEKVGGGLSWWFQCESTMDVTGNESFEKGFCARNSAIGLKGAFGNIFWGNWDTPAKNAATPARIWSTLGGFGNGELLWNGSADNAGNGSYAYDAANINLIGTANGCPGRTGFSRRQANSIFYHSPEWSGFQFQAGYSTLNEMTAATGAAPFSKPRLWSLGALYSNGPLYLGAGYERHRNYNPANQASCVVGVVPTAAQYCGGTDRLWNVAAAYTFAGVFKLSGIYTDVEYDVAGGRNVSRKAWGVYGDWNIQGPHRLRAGYTTAGDSKGTGGTGTAINLTAIRANGGAGSTGADQWSLQYAYAFSKRTELNFGYTRLNNDTNGRYRVDLAPRIQGNDEHVWVLGVRHSF